MKARTFEVSTSAYLLALHRRGGIQASPYVQKKREEIANFRRCQQELVATLDQRKKARSGDTLRAQTEKQ